MYMFVIIFVFFLYYDYYFLVMYWLIKVFCSFVVIVMRYLNLKSIYMYVRYYVFFIYFMITF